MSRSPHSHTDDYAPGTNQPPPRSYGVRRAMVKVLTALVTAGIGAGGAVAGEAAGFYEISDDDADCREYDTEDTDDTGPDPGDD